ncbi:hypothetical protein SNF32_07915, partial [Enterococcus mundtii]|nr:hypothetical protein [Enterococcus mundtii]
MSVIENLRKLGIPVPDFVKVRLKNGVISQRSRGSTKMIDRIFLKVLLG